MRVQCSNNSIRRFFQHWRRLEADTRFRQKRCTVVSACFHQSASAFHSPCVRFKSLHLYTSQVNFRVQEKSFRTETGLTHHSRPLRCCLCLSVRRERKVLPLPPPFPKRRKERRKGMKRKERKERTGTNEKN